jgi:hypothetical protein
MEDIKFIFRAYVFIICHNMPGYCTNIYAHIKENNRTKV